MAESVYVNFPKQNVSDDEKNSIEYGEKIGKAISAEWFSGDRGYDRHQSTHGSFHKLRLYARGEQSIQKYKDELSINGDLSYLNLDWTPVPIIPKFVDIVVNGIAERTYDIKAFSIDASGSEERSSFMEAVAGDMQMKAFDASMMQELNVDSTQSQMQQLPDSDEELALYMQLQYKQSIEIAEEQAIDVLLEGNNYELVKKRFFYDLAVLGIGAVKTDFNTSEGITVDYVDPANLIYSHTDSPYFDDIYYVGEVKSIPINELVKQFPHLSNDEIEEISQKGHYNRGSNRNRRQTNDRNIVQVLYFNYKTYNNEVYKVKKTGTGGERAILKTDRFNPPSDKTGDFTRESKKIEVLYDGVMVMGCDKLLKWGLAKNMIRSKSDFNKVKMNYSIVAPRMYEGRIESLVSRITGFADMIQLTHLKLQQVMSKMVPDGVYLDADGLAEIDLGNGTNYSPQEALNMFFQTGSVIGRSFTSEGDMNPGKVPIQEINSSGKGAKLQSLIQTYNYYLQMIRDVTGLNEARDGSMPDKNALVGIQKLAAANSNTATRHILQSGLLLTAETAEKLSLRISDVIEYSPTKKAFIEAIGHRNVAKLEELSELHLHDFGIFLELSPDEEEKQLLENNIQMSLQQGGIELEDAIDIREVKNLKLANQLLKIRRSKKQQMDRQQQMENIQAQTQSNQAAAQASSQAEVQKQNALTQSKIQLAQAQSQMDAQKMAAEVAAKKELMALEFQYNMQLKGVETKGLQDREKSKEDRKDERTKIQATQQSELIDQRNSQKPPKNFESAGNDTIGGGFGLEAFGAQ
jgi:hypothetical protein|tara:strand:- start:569 stop:2980 length:2412 start_codon:yes stop_codon:yes gene_type:complete